MLRQRCDLFLFVSPFRGGGSSTLQRSGSRTRRWVKVDGEKQPVEKQQRVSPWWKTDLSGHYVLSVKFGSKPVEFEKGKAGVIVQSKDKLSGVVDTLIAAVRAGELDEHLNQAAKARTVGKLKKAA